MSGMRRHMQRHTKMLGIKHVGNHTKNKSTILPMFGVIATLNADFRYRRKKRLQYNTPAFGRYAEHGRRD
jgi:hypothetical protein